MSKKSLRDKGRDLVETAGNRTMRRDMQARDQQPLFTSPELIREDTITVEAASKLPAHAPVPLGQVFDDMFGTASGDVDEWVHDTALDIIHCGEVLHLSLAEWGRVQRLVEEGVRRGLAARP